MNEERRRRWPWMLYEFVLGVAAGFSLGFFTWLVVERVVETRSLPLWPFALVGIVVTYSLVAVVRRRGSGGRLIHLLWIPVGVFVVVMVLVVLALQRLT